MSNDAQVGIGKDGTLVVKNRKWRRTRISTAEMEGKPKSYFTTKQIKTRKKNGKRVKRVKKSRK